MLSGPVISQQFLWHHSCTIYLLNIQQSAVSEWVSEFFKKNEEVDLCHTSQPLYFLHDGWWSGTYSYSEKKNYGGRYLCDEFPEPWASVVIQDSPILSHIVYRCHRSSWDMIKGGCLFSRWHTNTQVCLLCPALYILVLLVSWKHSFSLYSFSLLFCILIATIAVQEL